MIVISKGMLKNNEKITLVVVLSSNSCSFLNEKREGFILVKQTCV